MKKKIQEIKLNFQDGKQRVSENIDSIYNDILADYMLEVSELHSPLDENGLSYLQSLSESITDTTKELQELKADLDKCYDLKGIIDLSEKYPIFEGCEETLIGAFLGVNITIL
jgi:hypothetical protein